MAKVLISAHKMSFEGATLVAMRRLLIDGVEYHDGDRLPKGVISDRTARKMFEQGRVAVEVEAAPAEAAPEKSPVKAEKADTATTKAAKEEKPARGAKIGPSGDVDPLSYKAGEAKAEHRGFGKWFVLRGEEEFGPYSKAQVEHLV